MTDRYQVVETFYDGKTTYSVEPTEHNRYQYKPYMDPNTTKEQAISLCKRLNSPPPAPPIRKVIYP